MASEHAIAAIRAAKNLHRWGTWATTRFLEKRNVPWHLYLAAESAVEVRSLEHLKRLDAEWDGMCLPYCGDGNTRLKDLLPEADPFKDTKTIPLVA